MLWSVPADRYTAAESYTAPRENAAPSLLPDGIPYDALVSFCGKSKQPQRDLRLLEPMRYQGLLADGIPYRALDSACGNGPTAIAWATSVCCREGQLGGRWPSGRASNVAIRWDPIPRFGQCLRKWANSHRMGYLCVLPGGAAWRSLALRGSTNAVPRPPARWDPLPRFDSACGHGPTAIAWATSACCREGQLGGRWPSGRAPMRYQGLLPDGIPYRALDNACGNGPVAIAWATSVSCRGGAYWRSLALRDGLQRGHQHVREGHIRREPGSCGREPRLNF